MREAATKRTTETVARFQAEMNAEYLSAWATGQIARSIKAKVRNEKDGISVSFSALSGARNHLQYITAAMSGGFDDFPVEPYTLKPAHARLLAIRFPGRTRRFIRNKETGRMGGARAGAILKKQVEWGSATGGFDRDVIVEVSQSEGASFVADVTAAVAASITKATR
jgi:hypothetical protein